MSASLQQRCVDMCGGSALCVCVVKQRVRQTALSLLQNIIPEELLDIFKQLQSMFGIDPNIEISSSWCCGAKKQVETTTKRSIEDVKANVALRDCGNRARLTLLYR